MWLSHTSGRGQTGGRRPEAGVQEPAVAQVQGDVSLTKPRLGRGQGLRNPDETGTIYTS